MTRVRDPKSGRIYNVDDDQLKDWKELGYRVVKGAPVDDESSAAPKKSSK